MTTRVDEVLPGRDRRVEVATSAVLRVAAWPLSTIEGLACPALWRAALERDRGDGCEGCEGRDVDAAGEGFDAAYRAAWSAQCEQLQALTTSVAFDRALTVANPRVGERWRRNGGRARSAKARERRLQDTVVRFVLRAAGRPTPNGAWAAVVAVTDGGGGAEPALRVRPGPPSWWVQPSLGAFVALCRLLGHTEEYLRRGTFLLDATLHRRDGRWVVLGEQGWRTLPAHPFLDQLVAWFEAQPGSRLPLAPFVAAVAGGRNAGTADEAPSGGERTAWTALRALRDHGGVQAGLRVEHVGAPLDALRAVVAELPDAARTPWRHAVEQLAELCAAGGAGFERLDGAAWQSMLERADDVVRALWRAVGAPGDPPAGPALRVDHGGPWHAAWSPPLRDAVAGAVQDGLAVWAADGSAERYRRRHLTRLGDGGLLDVLWRATAAAEPPGAAGSADAAGAEPPGPERGSPQRAAPGHPLTRAEVFAAHFGTDDAFEVEDRWDTLAAVGGGAVNGDRAGDGAATLVADPAVLQGPWSVELEGVPAAGSELVVLDGDRVHLEWGRPQPALFCARHHQLAVAGDVVGELDAALAGRGRRSLDVVARDLLAVDAARRGELGARLELAERPVVQRSRLATAADGVIELTGAVEGGGAHLATAHSAAGSARLDPLSVLGEVLVNANGWELRSFGLPLSERERRHDGVLPEVRTTSGHVLRRRRLVLPAAWVTAAQGLDPPARFRRWARLVAGAGLGPLVSARAGEGAPLLVPVSSPLAVEAMFAALDHGDELVLAEPPPATMVCDGSGRRYVAELAVSWWRR